MLPPNIESAFVAALSREQVMTDADVLALYSHDETPRACLPLAVLFPREQNEVVALMRVAMAHGVVLVARGAGSGNVGGALPAPQSVVVSFECMNRILEVNAADRYMVVQPGVITAEIDRVAREHGLFYPPDPGSSAYCRIGGNLAMNAAGPRAVKYGVTRDYVLGLRAVTGTGQLIQTGCRTTKGVTGLDLTRLLVGSEGTLALITEATLKLLPAPEARATLRVCYASNADACRAVARVMSQDVVPCALEFMDRQSIAAIQAAGAATDLPAGTASLLMVEADGVADDLPRQVAALQQALAGEGMLELQQATDKDAVTALWLARKSLSHAVKLIAPLKINEDVVVPVSRLTELVVYIEQLAAEYILPIVSFGHAGNGNLHVNIMVDPADAVQMQRAKTALRLLFAKVLALGGTLSGEHGIGSEKRPYVDMEIDAATLDIMRRIKSQFDPDNLLNPHKLLPDAG
ncbi:MAG: FAD-linked oxidase C-terminal domain-containing protein [Sulfuriferula sp.]|nr:FAD-linked oxidase C-terminal domain-containing protein [Sulfuriferula sp.]